MNTKPSQQSVNNPHAVQWLRALHRLAPLQTELPPSAYSVAVALAYQTFGKGRNHVSFNIHDLSSFARIKVPTAYRALAILSRAGVIGRGRTSSQPGGIVAWLLNVETIPHDRPHVR